MPPTPTWHPESLAARLPFLRRRAALTAATRAFFTARGYQEVETPCLVPVPGMEVHLQAFRSEYLPHLGVGEARTALAAHLPGTGAEAPAGRRRRPGLRARPGLAQR